MISQTVLGALSVVGFYLSSPLQAYSALFAGGCVVVPTAYYAWITKTTLNASRLLFHGVLRMVLTAVFVAVAIVVVGIEPAGFFATLCVVQLGYLVK
ncbi:MAG: ATP synthase subunit I [Pseudomonadota bacterium]